MISMTTFLQSTLFSVLLASAGANAANLFVSHFEGEVSTLSLTTTDNATYSLNVTSSSTGCGQLPSWLTLDSDSETLYCTDEWWNEDSTVTAISLGPDGALTDTVQTVAEGGAVHNTLYSGEDGAQYLASAHYSNSAVTTFALPLESSSEILQKIEFTMAGPGPVPERQDAPHPHQVITDPTGSFLLSADLGADLIRVFSIDKTTGELGDCPAINVTGGAGPRHLAFRNTEEDARRRFKREESQNDTSIIFYVTNELSNTVSSYTATYPDSGCFEASEIQNLSPFPEGVPGPEDSAVAGVQIHGDSLYVANRGDESFDSHDSIARFSIDGDSGELTFEEITSSHGVYPRSFVINKAGDLVAIGNQVSSNVVIVERDVETGELGEKVAELPLGSEGEPGQEEGISGIIWAE